MVAALLTGYDGCGIDVIEQRRLTRTAVIRASGCT